MNIDKKKLKYSIKSQLLNFIKLLNDSKELNHVKPRCFIQRLLQMKI